jgi:dolichol-phosphate mannosyltransferase
VALAGAQALAGWGVLARLRRTAGGARVAPVAAAQSPAGASAGGGRISVVVPVLDEAGRLGPCLEGLLRQGPEVAEVVVVDGGSVDGTPALVRGYQARDGRVRLVDASPVPAGWNGKAWGLQVGLQHSSPGADWLLTIDADVRPGPGLARALVAHARRESLHVLSVATSQEVRGAGEALVHPSLLTTLVYRLGAPGRATRRVAEVQANGQCFLVRREVLLGAGGFTATRASLCEDVTLARHLALAGHAVGFYESDAPVSVRMYGGGWEAWRNWPRSLTLRDQYAGWLPVQGLLEVTLVQALPLPLLLWLLGRRRWGSLVGGTLVGVNAVLGAVRLGVLGGTARAYRRRPWTYWLSPLSDVPVALALWRSLGRREHTWRGRKMLDAEAAGAPLAGERHLLTATERSPA